MFQSYFLIKVCGLKAFESDHRLKKPQIPTLITTTQFEANVKYRCKREPTRQYSLRSSKCNAEKVN